MCEWLTSLDLIILEIAIISVILLPLHLCSFKRFIYSWTVHSRFRVVVVFIAEIVNLLFGFIERVALTTLSFELVPEFRILVLLVHPLCNLGYFTLPFVGSILTESIIIIIVVVGCLLRHILIDIVVIIDVIHLYATTLQAPHIRLVNRAR